MNNIRREQMREYIEKNKIVTIEELSQLMPDVSLMTIHRDLTYLQEQGHIEKVRGGARCTVDYSHEGAFFAREILNKGAKQALAAKAVPLIAGSRSIFLDAGTTMMAFAGMLPDTFANIVTTGPNIALELSKKANLTINLCGGTLNKSNLTLSGPAALESVSKLNIDTAFLVAAGYSAHCGFTCGKESEARIKIQVVAQARKTIMLMDTSKIERMLSHTFAGMEDFSTIVTEKDPKDLPADFLAAAEQAGAVVL